MPVKSHVNYRKLCFESFFKYFYLSCMVVSGCLGPIVFLFFFQDKTFLMELPVIPLVILNLSLNTFADPV